MRAKLFFHSAVTWRLGALLVLILPLSGLALSPALADPSYGISMYGKPALPEDFTSLPYANPDAPKGGTLVTGDVGTFDSLNPFIIKGTVPWQLRFFTHESLLERNWDEPFALYGLLAKSVETDPDRTWVEFTLNPKARFSDGTPVTTDDVIWSFKTLGTKGNVRYYSLWHQIDSITSPAPGKVKITFNTENRELPLIAGLIPILEKSQWEGKDFENSGLKTIPIGSGPYVVKSFEAGRDVVLQRNPDYWGKDLPIRQGVDNIDTIRIEFYGDQNVLFEAFKAGEVDFLREFNAEKWKRDYDFPAVQSGQIVKTEIPNQKPTGMTGFVMNTRRAPFNDIRVRDALMQAFNFEYINDTITGGKQPRISSYYANSTLAMRPGPAEGKVKALLEPFADSLPPDTLSGYTLPVGDGTERNRANLRKAANELTKAGWIIKDGRRVNEDTGQPFTFHILLKQGDAQNVSIADIYIQALKRLGIEATIDLVDPAQYQLRLVDYDFDMTDFRRDLSLSPGNEQRLYWGSDAADTPGSRNLMGMKSKAADAMITDMLKARSTDDFDAAVHALDRVLTAGRYVIPFFSYDVGRIAHQKDLTWSGKAPIYGDSVYFMPTTWYFGGDSKKDGSGH